MNICDYGCGKEATNQFKNGKWCCENHHSKCPFISSYHSLKITGKIASDETKRKMSSSMRKPHPNSKNKPKSETHRKNISLALKGREFTPEWRQKLKGNKSEEHIKKLRIAGIKRIIKSIKECAQINPNFNPLACKIIDEYGKGNGYNFKHAKNGGEFYIKELGYWVDGYDIERNTVIEVDERHHFDINGNLLKRDIRRQKEIKQFLECEFIRIKIIKGDINEILVISKQSKESGILSSI